MATWFPVAFSSTEPSGADRAMVRETETGLGALSAQGVGCSALGGSPCMTAEATNPPPASSYQRMSGSPPATS